MPGGRQAQSPPGQSARPAPTPRPPNPPGFGPAESGIVRVYDIRQLYLKITYPRLAVCTGDPESGKRKTPRRGLLFSTGLHSSPDSAVKSLLAKSLCRKTKMRNTFRAGLSAARISFS